MSVDTAVSVAATASCSTDWEQDSMEVMENPIGWYLGLMARRASFSLPILAKMFSDEELSLSGIHVK